MLSKIATILNPSNLLRDKRVQAGLVYLISLGFVLANSYLITKDKYVLAALPIGLAFILIAIYRFHWLFWMVLFLVPLSVPLKEFSIGLDINMFLPTEPILAGMMIIFLLRLALDGGYDRSVLRHPVTRIILLQVVWILITSITSTMPIVSVKFLLSRLWFLTVFYFLAIQFFKNPLNIRRFLWTLMVPLAGIIIVITLKHASIGLFDQKASNPAVDPFFNDHTLYGAVLSLFLPVAAGYVIQSPFKVWMKAGAFIVLSLLIAGLVFSYSRAAWISVAGGIIALLIILFKVPGRTVLLGFAILVVGFLVFGKTILMKMEGNNQDSSNNLGKHIESISNISTDASNLERLNRWSCAIRMFEEKPVFGFGPGTYMFQYAPYQKSSERTIISTNAADGGNAHSEYLGPLSEEGFLGGALMLLLVIASIVVGIRAYHKQTDAELKMVALTVLVGLITYYLHVTMNNFLDTDKASAGVWGFMAILVALDRKKELN
ncbi:MAG: O-antigen ligase family protein [Porphyromonadaceae bacterium]|nr:MAG: O-antigen ligase family protein [Porphyromonadaceae bacterium]